MDLDVNRLYLPSRRNQNGFDSEHRSRDRGDIHINVLNQRDMNEWIPLATVGKEMS